MKKNKQLWINIGVGIVCAVVFFFVGRMTAPAASAGLAGRGGFSSSTRAGFAGRGAATAAGGGFVSGQIMAVASDSITVSLANGNSENVFYSSSTSIVKPTDVSASNLTVGAMVMVGGTTNSDGSVTASTIQIRTAAGGAGAGQ